MKSAPLLLFILLSSNIAFGQLLSGQELLSKSIKFHDPKGNWALFNGELSISAEYPDGRIRESTVTINLPADYFKLQEKKGNDISQFTFKKGECTVAYNGSTDISEEVRKQNRLTCARGKTMKDYYTYLYGLPMKLRDSGTLVDPLVEKVNFMEKEYLRLKVTYDPEVGSDTWYFYFDPASFAMVVYQFYHDESKNDGEYISLNNLITFQSIKIPKSRSWYTNAEKKLLATDHLISVRVPE